MMKLMKYIGVGLLIGMFAACSLLLFGVIMNFIIYSFSPEIAFIILSSLTFGFIGLLLYTID